MLPKKILSVAMTTTTTTMMMALMSSSSFPSTSAFMNIPSLSSTTTTSKNYADQRSSLLLYVDGASNGGGEFEKASAAKNKNQNKNSKDNNEWGIPNSQTLDPFGDIPMTQLPNGGKVSLIGSGPGDPDLLTVKALRELQNPDTLVVSDRLVSQEILDVVKGEIKVARKLPGCAELAQEEIYWWVHQGLAQGKHVIRLKIGDPFVFGRGGEEILTFRKYGVEPEVVPVSGFIYRLCFLPSPEITFQFLMLLVFAFFVSFFPKYECIVYYREFRLHFRHHY